MSSALPQGIQQSCTNSLDLFFLRMTIFSNDSLSYLPTSHQPAYKILALYNIKRRKQTGQDTVGGVVWHMQNHKYYQFIMLSFAAGIHRSPVNSPHKCQWRGALMLALICTRTSDWVNNRSAGDLRCRHAHYDVIVMWHRPLSQYMLKDPAMLNAFM